jgi:hypothetical protein
MGFALIVVTLVRIKGPTIYLEGGGLAMFFFLNKYFDAEFSRKKYFSKQSARKKYSDSRFS